MILNVPLDAIDDNPWQSRLTYDPDGIAELAEDIRTLRHQRPDTLGLIQVPVGRVVLLDLDDPEQYDVISEKTMPGMDWSNGLESALTELVNKEQLLRGDWGMLRVQLGAGHRRLRAFQHLRKFNRQWQEMPVDIQPMDDRTMARIVRSENFKRTDPSPIEDARAFQRALDDPRLGYGSATELADDWGIHKATASNRMRLLQLPEEVQTLIDTRQLSERHGRELLPLVQIMTMPAEAIRLAKQALSGGMSSSDLGNRVRYTLYDQMRKMDNSIRDWEDVTGEAHGCRRFCKDCDHHIIYQRDSHCGEPNAYNKRIDRYHRDVEELASTAFECPISRKRIISQETFEESKLYGDGKGCLGRCVGYSFFEPWHAVAVDPKRFPNIYWSCDEDRENCACAAAAKEKGAGIQQLHEDPETQARLVEFDRRTKQQAEEVLGALRTELMNDWRALIDKLSDREYNLLYAYVVNRTTHDFERDDRAGLVAKVTRITTGSGSQYGGEMLYQAEEVRELAGRGSMVKRAEAMVAWLEEQAERAELEKWEEWQLERGGWRADRIDSRVQENPVTIGYITSDPVLSARWRAAREKLNEYGYYYKPLFSGENAAAA